MNPLWWFGLALGGFTVYKLLGPYPEKQREVTVEGRAYVVKRWKPGDKGKGTVYQVDRLVNGQPAARILFDDSFGGEVGPLSRSGDPTMVGQLMADMLHFPADILK